jgi:hypothetical protein
MEKETILAKIQVSIEFSQETLNWLHTIPKDQEDKEFWVGQKNGQYFFSEFKDTWDKILYASSEPVIKEYFSKLGIPEKNLPKLRVVESYPGTWFIHAAIVIAGSTGLSYAILKGISEIPKIADGLSELTNRLKQEFNEMTNSAVREKLNRNSNHQIPSSIKKPVQTSYSIDTRPMLALKPSSMKSHKLHLSAAISRDAFSLENLGDDLIRDISIGIFKNTTQQYHWDYGDSYTGIVDILSPHQTIMKNIEEFKSFNKESLDLSDNEDLFIDCWVQDSHGIYLFMFFLEKNI